MQCREMSSFHEEQYENINEEQVNKFLIKILKIPGVKVNREKFLRKTLIKYNYNQITIDRIISDGFSAGEILNMNEI